MMFVFTFFKSVGSFLKGVFEGTGSSVYQSPVKKERKRDSLGRFIKG